MKLRDSYVVFLIVCFCGSIRGEGDVRKPPSITKHPTARIIYRSDDTVILECEAQGVPAVSYEWMKNGFELNQNRLNIQRGAGGTVTIQHATSMDEGFYQCFARNQYGTALSITAHIQIAVLDTGSGTHAVLQKIVEEGMPFHIQADTRRSFPKPVYRWEMATDTVDRNPLPLYSSSRVQVAENGDLHFAYALPEDGLDGRIYKCTTYNPYLDVKAGGSYTRLTVTKNTSGVRQFAPALRVSSDDRTVAIIGGAVTLKCFFSGNPIPTVSWSGPSNALPIGRYKLNPFNTELTISNITAADEGDYICTASNTQGHIAHTLQMRVEAVPRFLNSGSGPLDINVTEGQSSTFHCKADAKPEAAIVWFQDGIELHPNNPPNRFVFSSDNKSLTIRNVCRDCVDRESKTDLMVIQCNASNVHGHTFASGYLNVLSKTKVTLISNHNLLVNVNEEYEVQFNCCVSSDPSTFPSIRWFKIGQFGDERVRNDPPFIWIAWGTLTIRINPNNTEDGGKDYLGEYKCVGDNGYSSDFKTAKLIAIKATTQESTQYRTGPSKGNSAPDTTLTEETHLVSDKTEEQSATNVSPVLMPGGLMIQDFWVWIIIATAILVLLLLVFSVCTTIIQCKQKAWNNDTSSKEENDRPTDLPADFIEPDYETIDDDFMKSVQNSQPSLASGSFLKGSKRDVQPRSDTYVSVGGVASSGLPAVKVLRQTVRNESIVMKRGREELSEIPEASESSVQTTEYMALAEREPAIQTEYDVLKEKEELNPVRYMSSKNPERVKRIKSWFV